eukprot:s1080_g14.t1
MINSQWPAGGEDPVGHDEAKAGFFQKWLEEGCPSVAPEDPEEDAEEPGDLSAENQQDWEQSELEHYSSYFQANYWTRSLGAKIPKGGMTTMALGAMTMSTRALGARIHGMAVATMTLGTRTGRRAMSTVASLALGVKTSRSTVPISSGPMTRPTMAMVHGAMMLRMIMELGPKKKSTTMLLAAAKSSRIGLGMLKVFCFFSPSSLSLKDMQPALRTEAPASSTGESDPPEILPGYKWWHGELVKMNQEELKMVQEHLHPEESPTGKQWKSGWMNRIFWLHSIDIHLASWALSSLEMLLELTLAFLGILLLMIIKLLKELNNTMYQVAGDLRNGELIDLVRDLKVQLDTLIDPKIAVMEEELGITEPVFGGSSNAMVGSP